jgi:hypothetical protein
MTGCKHQEDEGIVYCKIGIYPSGVCEHYNTQCDEISCEGFEKIIRNCGVCGRPFEIVCEDDSLFCSLRCFGEFHELSESEINKLKAEGFVEVA